MKKTPSRLGNRKLVTFTIGSYALYQFVTAGLAIAKIPLTINSIGIENFAVLAVVSAMWTLLSIPGETSRRQSRISYSLNNSLSLNPVMFIFDVLLILIFSSLFVGIYLLNQQQHVATFVVLQIIFAVGAVANSFTGVFHGIIEGLHRADIANSISIAGNILGFLIYLMCLVSKSVIVISIAQCLSIVLPGILMSIYSKFIGVKIEVRIQDLKTQLKSRINWSLLQFFEMLSIALNGYLILLILNSTSAAEFSLYQKMLIVMTATTSALGPYFSVTNRNNTNQNGIIRVELMNILFTSSVGVIMLLIGSFLFKSLASNKLEFKSPILISLIISSLAGAVSSRTTQSSNSGRQFRIRLYSTGIASVLAIIGSIIFIPKFGVATVFYGGAFNSLIVLFSIKTFGKQNED
jgi:O-antigen/teichoic acid export membrane protein